MKFQPLPLKDAYLVATEPYTDERGRFSRFYCKKEFDTVGHIKEWVQLNHSITLKEGTIRGMHFQLPPFREVKMIKCIKGKVFDVIIDIRKGSATFLQWFGTELSDENQLMMYIPEGFAHGFQCLSDDCHLLYHHTEYYTPGSEGGIRYDDPLINIKWPMPLSLISDRDQDHPYLNNHFKGIDI
ncbi:MAG: dTDP-4-dehydrorhamnose 3,5-epimerase [Flavisolibacter sp.]|jgi:dTDP-4-dehydrorhamnose 3,5-epimerase|nr:dTDP-4-dehydrorhamnose 3,5-epimerase [Flavisolibacter sp.]